MIRFHGRNGARAVSQGEPSEDWVWIDLLDPNEAERDTAGRLLGASMPTLDDMHGIEATNRLYSTPEADYLTIALPFVGEDTHRAFAPVTFVLARGRLATLRYVDLKSFDLFGESLAQSFPGADGTEDLSKVPPARTGLAILAGLVEAVIGRVADLLESVALDLDRIGNDIFRSSAGRAPLSTSAFKELLRRIGSAGDLVSRTRESLATMERMLPFLQTVIEREKGNREPRSRLKAMGRDIQSLNDFAAFLSNRTSFLLDTTVGMISIEQNGIIKIFSVAAVGFMPPTLVASIYGMNFRFMPELDWTFGYPFALSMMLLSAAVPLAFFRWKKWL